MIYEIALQKEVLFSDLFVILESHLQELDKKQQKTFDGICYLEGELLERNVPEDVFMSDVNVVLNTTIELLTELESDNKLTSQEKKDFDDICNRVLEGQEIECSKHIGVGKMIICEGLPYQICEIDYDDFSVKLWSGDELDGGHWDSPLNCKKSV